MTTYRISQGACRDLDQIARYTIKKWGVEQAGRYADGLQTLCELIARQPALGRTVETRPGLRRTEHASHVVFYRVQAEGILITRVLHKAGCRADTCEPRSYSEQEYANFAIRKT